MTFYEELEPDKPGMLYEKMADHLARRIKRGDLPPDTRLPAERRLAQEYGVSLGTARHATELLRSKGLVITVPCKGTYVAGVGRSSEPSTARSTLLAFRP